MKNTFQIQSDRTFTSFLLFDDLCCGRERLEIALSISKFCKGTCNNYSSSDFRMMNLFKGKLYLVADEKE